MKIALLAGDCPLGACGVGDYTRRLASALKSIGIDADLLSGSRWGSVDVGNACRSLNRLKPDIVHIQYPTSGFGHRLGPQLLAMMKRSITTFHEGSESHILRKLCLYPFTVRAQHIIFTSEYERQFAIRWAPWTRKCSSVIPIGSNVEAHPSNGARRSCREVVYFGLLMPHKGLEDVIALAAMIGKRGLDITVRVIGSHRPEHAAYLAELRHKSSGLAVIWDEGLPGAQVSQRLAAASVAYLPYPDGASERRATLKAALLNGVAVVTTQGPATPEDLKNVVKFAGSPRRALEIILPLLSDESRRSNLGRQGVEYAEKFSWTKIAQEHSRIYDQFVGKHAIEALRAASAQ